MSFTSTIYTMGTALNRAHDHHLRVAILVDGQWMHGHVAGLDGHGVVLDHDGAEHSVVKIDRISAVRITAAAPDATPTARPLARTN